MFTLKDIFSMEELRNYCKIPATRTLAFKNACDSRLKIRDLNINNNDNGQSEDYQNREIQKSEEKYRFTVYFVDPIVSTVGFDNETSFDDTA